MTYDETAFQQDEKRRRKNEQLVKCRQRREENKVQEHKRIRELNKLRQDEGNSNGYTTMETTMGILLT